MRFACIATACLALPLWLFGLAVLALSLADLLT